MDLGARLTEKSEVQSEQLISWLSRLVKRESRGGRLGDLQGFRGDVCLGGPRVS